MIILESVIIMMINLLNEIADILNKYNIRLNDVKIIFDGELLKHD